MSPPPGFRSAMLAISISLASPCHFLRRQWLHDAAGYAYDAAAYMMLLFADAHPFITITAHAFFSSFTFSRLICRHLHLFHAIFSPLPYAAAMLLIDAIARCYCYATLMLDAAMPYRWSAVCYFSC